MSVPFPRVPYLGSLTGWARSGHHEQAAGLKASLGTAVLIADLFRNELSFEEFDMGLFYPSVRLQPYCLGVCIGVYKN